MDTDSPYRCRFVRNRPTLVAFGAMLLATVLLLVLDAGTDLFDRAVSPGGLCVYVGAAAGALALLAVPALRTRRSIGAFAWVLFPMLLVVYAFVSHPVLVGHDTGIIHYPIFTYVSQFLAEHGSPPEWFDYRGGVPAAMFYVNYMLTIPSRLLGAALSLGLPAHPLLVYKLQYFLGIVLMGWGVWLVVERLTRSRLAAYFGTAMVVMGGTGITVHQEQVLATAHLIPWFVLALLNLPRDRSFVLPLAILFAIGCATHYPQIQVISLGLLLLAAAVLFRQQEQRREVSRKFLAATAAIAMLALAPAAYLYLHAGQFSSPMRASEELHVARWAEYLELNLQMTSSSPWTYFGNLVTPTFDSDDKCSFFVGRIGLLLALLSPLLVRPKRRRAAVVGLGLAGAFAALCLGINFIAARALFIVRFPMIDTFRQWHHFFPMFNYCLAALAGLSIAAIAERVVGSWRRWLHALPVVLLVLNVADLASFGRNYLRSFRLGEDQLSTRVEAALHAAPLFVYKSRMKLEASCPEAIPAEPFVTRAVIRTSGGPDAERMEACRLASVSRKSVAVPPDMEFRGSGSATPADSGEPAEVRSRFDGNRLVMELSLREQALVVTPLNYELEPRAYQDGREVAMWRINGTLAGVVVAAGEHRVELRMDRGVLAALGLLQIGLYGLVAWFFVRRLRRNPA